MKSGSARERARRAARRRRLDGYELAADESADGSDPVCSGELRAAVLAESDLYDLPRCKMDVALSNREQLRTVATRFGHTSRFYRNDHYSCSCPSPIAVLEDGPSRFRVSIVRLDVRDPSPDRSRCDPRRRVSVLAAVDIDEDCCVTAGRRGATASPDSVVRRDVGGAPVGWIDRVRRPRDEVVSQGATGRPRTTVVFSGWTATS